MIDEKVAAPVQISKFVAVHMPTILMPVEVAVPVVLTDVISHKFYSFRVIISWHKICFCLHQYP